MNIIGIILRFGLVVLLIHLLSCEKENVATDRTGFYIEISDGTIISENDILYYDSTSCIFFLKEPLYISYKESELGNLLYNEFTVFVNADTIYRGIIYPYDYNFSAMPPLPFVIFRDIHDLDRSVLEINYVGFTGDLRNDSRIIDRLNEKGLVYSGINFTINRVEVFGEYYGDSVACEITIQNPDPVNYYILDPQKMGEAYYNFYNRGVEFKIQPSGSLFKFSGIYHSEYGKIDESDFSVIAPGGSKTFTFGSKEYFITFEGTYTCNFSLRYRSSSIDLNQPNGRIWTGKVSSGIDNIEVKFQWHDNT